MIINIRKVVMGFMMLVISVSLCSESFAAGIHKHGSHKTHQKAK